MSRRHRVEERRLDDRIEHLHSEAPPLWAWGGLAAAVRDDGSGTQRLEAAQRLAARRLARLQERRTVRPGGLRAVMRVAVLVACPLVLVAVADLVVDALPDHQAVSTAAVGAVAAAAIAAFGLAGRRRGLHDLIAPTVGVRG